MMIPRNVTISVRNVKKSFRGKTVLKGVNIEVNRGSIFALLGANGAGKTTLLKIMTTLLKQDSGEVKINGYDTINDAFNAKKEFTLTGQFVAIDEELTGYDNLRMIAELNLLKQIDEKIDQLLAMFQLKDVARQAVNTYSGGMRRRLDIAMSIISEPTIIFLDEPTTGLDPQNRATMWALVKSLANAGTTIFLTTQYLEEAEFLADKIAILNNGEIVKSGTPEALKKTLPQGIIAFSFQSDEDFLVAKELLKSFKYTDKNETLTLEIITDGSLKQLTNVFNKINNANITFASFTQKLPTLEDVFYHIVNGEVEF